MNIFPTSLKVSSEDRERLKGHKSCVVWLTGLSGSGKTTLSFATDKKLSELNYHSYVLDGDNLRSGINAGLGFTQVDRSENLRRAAEVARILADSGLIVLAGFISPLREDREMIYSIIGRDNIIEVHVNTPLAICEERDVKGLYKKARNGTIENFTGISSPYEVPLSPDLTINTNELELEESCNKIIEKIIEKCRIKA